MVPHKTLIAVLVHLWVSLCYAQTRYWRGDTRDPETIRQAGGFLPRGSSRVLGITGDVSMFNHARDANDDGSPFESGYVATSTDREVALRFVNARGGGYIYEIHASPNFINVEATLQGWNPYPDESEYAVLGGINWEQVVGWQEVRNRRPGIITSNSDYNTRYTQLSATVRGEPRLAGFPPQHAAWDLAPWNAFAPGGCGGLPRSRRSLITRQTQTCDNFNQLAAESWMDQNCSAGACGGS